MDFSFFDIIMFAFALPDSNYNLAWDTDNAPYLLRSLVSSAHQAGSSVMLSIGGWTGSQHFSRAVSPENRETFTNNILAVYHEYDLDGIDIDWEYPGQRSQPGNDESPDDTANMLQFFQLLRTKLPQGAWISAAVQDSPFVDQDGHPIKDASGFAKQVNFITLMNYDTFETSSPPGPNAPLYDGCNNSSQPSENAVAAYNAWTGAGFPSSQIVLGLPLYGYIVPSGASNLRQRSPNPRIARSSDDSGQIQFDDLVVQQILSRNPDGSFTPTGGFTRSWDGCSATPFLHSGRQVIPYDDPESLGAKAAWARQVRLGGVNLFDLHGDTFQWDLTKAVRSSLIGANPSPTNPSSPTSPTSITPSPLIILPLIP
ncbi:glycoside hydrolase family 18 protein [Phlebopus sp. FC_14]|nr:glycoside hydrolase family 18 protein [Phlebopus sp. FC_14]